MEGWFVWEIGPADRLGDGLQVGEQVIPEGVGGLPSTTRATVDREVAKLPDML
jgi:hypothetical protein